MRKHKSSNFNKFVFIALFGAMALTAFRLVSKPTNLLQGVLAPLPQASLLVGSSSNSQNDEPGDEAKFFAIERTANGVDLVLHRPEDVSSDMLEVTLVGSTNLVTATWSPFMNVTFPEGETNVSATVTGAMLDAHSVSNMCFFAFINAGDSDADGLADWDERFNLKTDPYSTDSDGDDLDDVLDPEPAVFDPFSRAHWTLWDDSTVFAGGSDVGVVFETTVPVRRRSLWRQYFLSGSQDGAAAWALDGHQLEWRCSADAPWTVLVPPAGDSLRLQLPADAEWVAFRLRLSADGAPPVRPPPLHLLTYRPHVSVEAEIVEEEDGLRRVLAVFTDGDESLVPISVDRSGRPCSAPLDLEETDVEALLEDDCERAGIEVPDGGLGYVCFGSADFSFNSGSDSNTVDGGSGSDSNSGSDSSSGSVDEGAYRPPRRGRNPWPGSEDPGDGTWRRGILVLDPSVVFGPDSCSDAPRVVWDAGTGTHSPALDWPLDTACLRRAWRSDAGGGTVNFTTSFDGASSRVVQTSVTGRSYTTYFHDGLGEIAQTARDGVSVYESRTYERDPDDGELYRVERASRRVVAAFGEMVPVRETRTRLTGLSKEEGGILSRRVVIDEGGHRRCEERGKCTGDYWVFPDFFETVRWIDNGVPVVAYGRKGFDFSEYGADGDVQWYYDGMGRVSSVHRADVFDGASDSHYGYDCSGNVASVDFLSYGFAGWGDECWTTLAVGHDALGRETTRTDTFGHVVTNAYDALGRPALANGDRHPVSTGHDASGNRTRLATTRDGGATWDATQWEYAVPGGSATAKVYADNSRVAYTCTQEGWPVRTTWARGAWKEYSYDGHGNVTGMSYSSMPSVTCVYDLLDCLVSAENSATGADHFSYACSHDEHRNCTEEAVSVGNESFTISRTFDELLRPSSVSVSSCGTAYAAKTRNYDSENRVSGYTLGGDGSSGSMLGVSVSYQGHLPVGMTYTFPNGNTLTLALTREPGRATWIKRRDYAFNNTTLYWHRTDYDAEGRPTETEDSLTATRQWLYNRRSELTSMTEDTAHPRYSYFFCDYAYDSAGNRTFADGGVIPPSVDYTANSLNQYASIQWTAYGMSNAFQPVYDADGNLVQDDRFTYAYDDENRLVSVSVRESSLFYGARAVENAYDHRSRRIRKVVKAYDGEAWQITETHTFVWDGWNIVFEQIDYPSAPSRHVEYFWGNDVSGTEEGAGGVGGLLATRIDGEFSVPVYDGNGNIVMYVDQTGRVVAQYDYDPYGGVLSPLYLNGESWDHTLWNFGFSTKYRDWETDLVPYQLRTYDPLHGRWLNRDPIEERGGENLYVFCGNCPDVYYDSFGCSWEIKREGEIFAKARATSSTDTFQNLAAQIKLDTKDYRLWAHTTDSSPVKCKEYNIPNLIVYDNGRRKLVDHIPWNIISVWQRQNEVRANLDRSSGFMVLFRTDVSSDRISSALSKDGLYSYTFSGHGDGGTGINSYPDPFDTVDPFMRYTKYGISNLTLQACGSAAIDKFGENKINGLVRRNNWECNVATVGFFIGYEGSVNLLNEVLEWTIVRGSNNWR